MRVFISWSGEPSRSVASALRDWLPMVVLGTASGSSFANAKSFYDIETWAATVAPGTEILFHHLDDFHVPGHGNSPFFRVTLNGAKGSPIILRGALPDGSPAP